MHSIVFITIDEVVKIHEKQIASFGGAHGIRDHYLLASAINMPMSTFGGDYLYPDILHMAAAYMFYIIKNHAFVDGNKRTGVVVALAFLMANKIQVSLSQEEVFDLALQIATSELSIDGLANYFKMSIKMNAVSQ